MSRRKVGKKMGVTMTDEAQLRRPVRPIDWEKVDAITRKLAAMPILDSRTPDEIWPPQLSKWRAPDGD